MHWRTFPSKAQTLLGLTGELTTAQVPTLQIFTQTEWEQDPAAIVASIQQSFEFPIIIRSSARAEDTPDGSMAGAFTSIPNVDPLDRDALVSSINRVVKSYGTSRGNEFFAQAMVRPVCMSGVICTHVVETLAPYVVIAYDDTTGASDTVTSGRGQHIKTYVRYRHSPHRPTTPRLQRLVELVSELEQLFNNDCLDIEFAFGTDESLYLLQVRPLAGKAAHRSGTDSSFDDPLLRIFKKIQKLNQPHPGVLGRRAIYSVMTDWNPAEMIGLRPRTLALSLYKELITDSIWAYQRHRYGYRDLRSFPLLVSFMGLPYIDVRASLNSFIPSALGPRVSEKLAEYYLAMVAEHPASHDKVEFDVVHSCFHFRLTEDLAPLRDRGFAEQDLAELQAALCDLTRRIVLPDSQLLSDDLARIATLESRYRDIMDSQLPLIDRIYWMVEDCKRYGTLPFAGLARAGFIAVQILRSMESTGILTFEETERFMSSLQTVTRRLANHLHDVTLGARDQASFLATYGHLRPGSYDILSTRYDEAWDRYFGSVASAHPDPCHAVVDPPPFRLNERQQREVGGRLKASGIALSSDELMRFLRQAIEAREQGKFLFTRHLSQVLTLVGELASRFGFSKEDASHLHIRPILELYSQLTNADLGSLLGEDIRRNRALAQLTATIQLPQLIVHENEVYDFHIGTVEPNFITHARITQIIALEQDLPNIDLRNKIVFIRSADPGYDWIFSRHVAGLVTMYGGANSHMAIRCAELQLPAVIGCGETNYAAWSRSKLLEIDCSNRCVRAVR